MYDNNLAHAESKQNPYLISLRRPALHWSKNNLLVFIKLHIGTVDHHDIFALTMQSRLGHTTERITQTVWISYFYILYRSTSIIVTIAVVFPWGCSWPRTSHGLGNIWLTPTYKVNFGSFKVQGQWSNVSSKRTRSLVAVCNIWKEWEVGRVGGTEKPTGWWRFGISKNEI